MTSAPDPSTARLPQAWWCFVLVGGVLVAAYHWVPDGTPAAIYYVGVGVLGLVAMAAGIHLRRPVRRAPWIVLLSGQTMWVLADAVGAVITAQSDVERFPTVADAFYLAGYPLLVTALLMLTRGRRPPRDVEGLLDGLTVLIGLSLLAMAVIGEPVTPDNGGTLLGLVVGIAYPQLDIVVAATLAALITTPGARTSALKLLVLALGLVVTADITAAALSRMTFDSAGGLDLFWLASYILLGAALLHPSLHQLSIPVPAARGQFSGGRLAATILATLVPPAVLVGEHLRDESIKVWPIALASAAMFLLVIGRMTLVIRQIAAAQEAREQAQAALSYQASHDFLTRLPNRAQSLELIGGSMARAQRSGDMVGLLFVDLDGFKAVNDGYGHQGGDEVLQAVAARMQAAVRQGDMVGRLGGDEFVVLLEPVIEAESALAVAQRLIAEVSRPISLRNGQPVRVGASVGVAISQDAGTDADSLLNEADTASYRAKRLGRGRVELFGESLRRELHERSEVERGLRHAIEQDLLVLEYEAVMEVSSGSEVGYESRVSWDRPGVGLVPSQEFEPVIALSDLVFDLESWVLRQATRQLAVWNALGGRQLRMGVDVSARYLARARVVDDVWQAVEEAGIQPWQLILEVTDTTLVDDPVGFSHLERLRELGVEVGLEDFGTGYSSVRRLQRLPIDVVKLDTGFLDWRTSSGVGLLRLMIQGVQNFGLPLVVTGVVDPEQHALLQSMGCDIMEGPYFGGPFTPAEVAQRISRRQTVAPVP